MTQNHNIFGKRICVVGPSNCGKSTFSAKLAAKLGYSLMHMDQIAHVPNTNWIKRPCEQIRQEHDEFITKDTWVIDGQYKKYMPKRLARADTLVRIHVGRFKCLFRYFKRCAKRGKYMGALDGATRTLNSSMIPWILFNQPKRAKERDKIIKQFPHLNIIDVYSFKELDELLKRV